MNPLLRIWNKKFRAGMTLDAGVNLALVGVIVLAVIYTAIYLVLFSSYSRVVQESVAASPAWYDSGWSHRIALTIPAGKTTGTLSNFPIYVNYTDSSLQTAPQADGDDIMFVDHSGTAVQISHELINYDQSAGEVRAWVEIPTIDGSLDTTIYMYYGNSTVAAQEDPAGTFNAFQGVWHLDEDPTTGSDVDKYQDSTGKSDAGDRYETTTGGSIFDGGVNFDGYYDSQITVDSSSTINIDDNDFFISFWAQITDSIGPSAFPVTLFSKGAGTSGKYNWVELFIEEDRLRVREQDNGSVGRGPAFTPDNDWHYYAVRLNETNGWNSVGIYVDGVLAWGRTDTENNNGLNNSDGYDLLIGSRNAVRSFTGYMDEFRLARGTTGSASANWFAAEYANGTDPGFVVFDGPEKAGDIDSVLVTNSGFVTTNFDIPTADALLVGSLSIFDQYNGRDIEGLTLTDTGPGADDEFENMRAYYEYDTSAPYDCDSESYGGTETLYATGVDGLNVFDFTGTLPIYNDRSLCMYFVVDVVEPDIYLGDLDIPYQYEIADLDNDLLLSQGSVNTASSNGLVANGNVQTPVPTITAAAIGSENTIEAGEAVYLGGAFTFSINTDSANISSISLTQNGSIDANTYMQEVRSYYEYDTSAPYDCNSESFDGTEAMLTGPRDPGPYNPITGYVFTLNGFYDTITVTPTQTMCLYLVSNNTYSGADTDFNIDLGNPSGNVIATESVEPGTTVSPSGSGTVLGTPSGDGLAWFNTNWGYRKQVYVDNTDIVGTDDFYMHPVPIRITDTNLQSRAQADADDIFFTNKFGTKLSHEIEYYDTATGELVAWVKTPHLYYSIDTPLYMYYGNSGASNQEDIENTWSSEFEMVHHFEEDFMSGTDNPADSTANNHDTTAITDPSYGYTAQLDSPLGEGFGVISADSAAGVDLDATPAGSLDPNGDFTVSLWYQADTSNFCGDMVAKRNTIAFYPGFENQYIINCQLGSGINPGFNFTYGTGTDRANMPTTLVDGTWYNIVAVKRGTDLEIYVDGTSTGATFGTYTGSVLPQDDALDFEVPGINPLNGSKAEGTFDEVRFAPVARSAEWIETDYNLQVVGETTNIGTEDPLNDLPVVTSVTLNSGVNINLTEGDTTTVNVSAQVTDVNGYADIIGATAKIYRSGVGSSCGADDNNCYATSCSLINCSGNSCDISCSVDLQYYAEPTDSGAYSSEYWLAEVEATDSYSATALASSPTNTTDVNSLVAVEIQGSLNYGTVDPGDDSGSTNSLLTVENTGNTTVDLELSGDDLCTDYPTCSGATIPVTNQEYNTTSFTYGSGTSLTGTPTDLILNLVKSTSIGSPSTSQLFWGIAIPGGTIPGDYSGSNTISATQP